MKRYSLKFLKENSNWFEQSLILRKNSFNFKSFLKEYQNYNDLKKNLDLKIFLKRKNKIKNKEEIQKKKKEIFKLKKKLISQELLLPNLLDVESFKKFSVENNKSFIEYEKIFLHSPTGKKYANRLFQNKEIIYKTSFNSGVITYSEHLANLEYEIIFKLKEFLQKKYVFYSSLPLILNQNIFEGIGCFPQLKEELFQVSNNQFLIPTGEVPLIGMWHDSLFFQFERIKAFSITECFRKEFGKNRIVKNISRMINFKKFEIIRIEKEGNSQKILLEMLKDVREILEKNKISYRLVNLHPCDLSFQSSITYDIEVFLPYTCGWMEISSIS